MISTESQQKRENFEKYKLTLEQEPAGDVKKRYHVGCYNASNWVDIHEELMKDGSLEDNIPNDPVECVNDYDHSPTRGIYLLTPSEVSDLKNHPKVKYVNIDTDYYSGTYEQFPDDLIATSPTSKTYRYANSEKCYRDFESVIPSTATAAEVNRSGYQLRRCMQKEDPWYGGSDSTVFNNRLEYYGDGTGVDIVVCDTQAWFGHPEFCNNTGNGPTNYTGGNVLKSGFSSSAATGYCDVLDMILDAPYYLDPDFFEAASNINIPKLITRWDGTKVPHEYWAKGWWGYNTTSNRSAKYASGGSNAFGTISISASYTRDNCNGSNTTRQYGGYLEPLGAQTHGTCCCACAFGRTQGWAFNANKWFINAIGNYNPGVGAAWEIQQIFHKNKPGNSSEGNSKDPTISSNSWGYRQGKLSSGYWWYRTGLADAANGSWTTPSSGTHRYSPYNNTGNTMPEFYRYIGWEGDATWNGSYYSPRVKGEMKPSSLVTALDDCIDEGVIVVVAAGNSTQKQVKIDHPDYNNYWSTSSTGTITDTHVSFGYDHYNTLNRPGYPQQGGKNSSAGITNRIINVGALDDELTSYGGSTTGQERLAGYSDKGNAIDVYAPGDDTLTATSAASGEAEYPETYTQYDSTNLGDPQDDDFGGTSSACPVAAGLLATKLQYARNWTVENVKSWIENDLDVVDSTKFYVGTETVGANNSDWVKICSPEYTSPIVLYDKRVDDSTYRMSGPLNLTGSLNFKF